MSDKKFDITSTAIEKGIDLVSGFIEKLAGSSLEEAGLLLSDKIKTRRLKNQIQIFSDAKRIAEENNIPLKQINLKTLVPLLEFSSLEEDETLQQKWSNLVVNYGSADEKYESSIFPFILNQLTNEDINVIENLYQQEQGITISSGIVQENLSRLGLIEANNPRKIVYIRNSKSTMPNYTLYSLTKLGLSFYDCCSNKKQKKCPYEYNK